MSRSDQHLGPLTHLVLNRGLELLLLARSGLLSLDHWGSVLRGLAGLLDRKSNRVRRTIAYLNRIMGTKMCLMMRDRRRGW